MFMVVDIKDLMQCFLNIAACGQEVYNNAGQQ